MLPCREQLIRSEIIHKSMYISDCGQTSFAIYAGILKDLSLSRKQRKCSYF